MRILEVRNLQTRFATNNAGHAAVDGISFELNREETLGIVGESGSGKSMTALSIMNLVPSPGKITGGEVVFYKRDANPVSLQSLPARQMRNYRGHEIAMIFQEPMTSLNPVFTCGNQVQEALMLHLNFTGREAKARTLSLFEKVKLPGPARIFRSYPHQLSGGQKQRVMIAMAISCEPSILIADEPTTALDVTVQAHILELLDELRREKEMSLVFITHDLGVVAEIADRVLVMYKGKIVEQGTVDEIFSNPAHPYTKGLLACRPPLKVKLRKLPVINDFMREEPDGTVVELPLEVNEALEHNIISGEEIENRFERLISNEPVLSVRNLKTWFSAEKNFFGGSALVTKAVDDVTFDVYPGETLGLVGESGCGKTTLGRSILQLVPPTAGQVIFEKQELTLLPREEMQKVRRNISIIFQDPYSSLNPRLTAGYAIMEPMRVHGIYANDEERREAVFQLLHKVNMPANSYSRFPHEFSGGQRQRLCIARMLALSPRFIICDEAVSALDVSVQAQVLNLLIALRDEFHFTCIFISHDLSVVKFMSDRLMVMNDGKIEEIGKADDVYYHPSSEYTRKLIDAIPKGDLAAIRRRMERQKSTGASY